VRRKERKTRARKAERFCEEKAFGPGRLKDAWTRLFLPEVFERKKGSFSRIRFLVGESVNDDDRGGVLRRPMKSVALVNCL
jgi:hypothetical protein